MDSTRCTDGQVPSTGLTVVVNPRHPNIDIVFVHGFNGHPERTWMQKHRFRNEPSSTSGEPPAKIVKLRNVFSSSESKADAHKTSPVFWPRDLVPQILPDARVLTFGYDSKIRHVLEAPVSTHSIKDIAREFMFALEAERHGRPRRPLIFVAHSLGGIVVKAMLRESDNSEDKQDPLRRVFDSTTGIVFFGTPHGGSDPQGSLFRIAKRVYQALGHRANEEIINTLLPNSSKLRELRDHFNDTAMQRKWDIHSFQEEYGIMALQNEKVVDDMSSSLGLPAVETVQRIGKNHHNMARFDKIEDPEFKKVAAALKRLAEAKSELGRGFRLSEQQRIKLVEFLRFSQIDARHLTIKKAHIKTCEWLLKDPRYIDWLDASKLNHHYGILWMKGNPGTGKSTIMEYALGHAKQTMKDKIIVSFFFNARGESLEKSIEGLYRSILLQLLETREYLHYVFDHLGLTTWHGTAHEWTLEGLKMVLEKTILGLSRQNISLVCYIDALDECQESQVRDMLSFFEQVGELVNVSALNSSGPIFQVFFSSRHYPNITVTNGLQLILEHQKGHDEDIKKFISSQLKIGQSKLANTVRMELKTKASGILIWVALVVDILNREFDKGRIHTLQRRLREIPGDLHQLFHDILVRDGNDKEETLLCIQWILFSKTPLTPEQLYFAIRSGTDPENLSFWDQEEISPAYMNTFILNASKGLSEATRSTNPTIQFIHESIREFLLKDNNFNFFELKAGSNLEGSSHDQLKQCCLNYIGTDFAPQVDFNEHIPPVKSLALGELQYNLNTNFPFLTYAIDNVLWHANQAARNYIGHARLSDYFPLHRWVHLKNIFAGHQINRLTPGVSSLYVLSRENAPYLIKSQSSLLTCIQAERERYTWPLWAAIALQNPNVLEILFHALVKSLPNPDLFMKEYGSNFNAAEIVSHFDITKLYEEGLLQSLSQLGTVVLASLVIQVNSPSIDHAVELDSIGRVLHQAARDGHDGIVQLLLTVGMINPDTKGEGGGSSLATAVKSSPFSIVRMLLDRGEFPLEYKDPSGQTPLFAAAQRGHETIVELLLNTGKVNPDNADLNGRTPLLAAVEKGYVKIVNMLLKTGKVDPNSRGGHYMTTPLWIATKAGDESILHLLLDTGKVDSNIPCGYNMTTPLWVAAEVGNARFVEMLLNMGNANPDFGGNDDNATPLWIASERGHDKIVDLLLNTGRVDLNAKNNDGCSILSQAIEYGNERIIELLTQTGKLE